MYVAHIIGGALGGVLLGAACLLVRDAVTFVGTSAAADALAGLILGLGLLVPPRSVMRLPQSHAQVPVHWLQWNRPARTGLAWGFLTGAGFLTFISTPLFYALTGFMPLVEPWTAVMMIAALYGSFRSLTVAISGTLNRQLGYFAMDRAPAVALAARGARLGAYPLVIGVLVARFLST